MRVGPPAPARLGTPKTPSPSPGPIPTSHSRLTLTPILALALTLSPHSHSHSFPTGGSHVLATSLGSQYLYGGRQVRGQDVRRPGAWESKGHGHAGGGGEAPWLCVALALAWVLFG